MEGCAGGRVPYTADRRNFCSICGVTVEAARAPTLLIVSSITDFLRYDCACTLCHSHVDSYRQENVTVLSHMFNLKYKSNEQGFWQNTENDIFSFCSIIFIVLLWKRIVSQTYSTVPKLGSSAIKDRRDVLKVVAHFTTVFRHITRFIFVRLNNEAQIGQNLRTI